MVGADVLLDGVLYRVGALVELGARLAVVRPLVRVEVLVQQFPQVVGKGERLEVARVAK